MNRRSGRSEQRAAGRNIEWLLPIEWVIVLFPEARKFLGERYVDVKVMADECLDVLRRSINYYHLSHFGSSVLSVEITGFRSTLPNP